MTETETDDATEAFTAIGASLAKNNDNTDAPAWAIDLITEIEGLEARLQSLEEKKYAWADDLAEKIEGLDENVSELEERFARS